MSIDWTDDKTWGDGLQAYKRLDYGQTYYLFKMPLAPVGEVFVGLVGPGEDNTNPLFQCAGADPNQVTLAVFDWWEKSGREAAQKSFEVGHKLTTEGEG